MGQWSSWYPHEWVGVPGVCEGHWPLGMCQATGGRGGRERTQSAGKPGRSKSWELSWRDQDSFILQKIRVLCTSFWQVRMGVEGAGRIHSVLCTEARFMLAGRGSSGLPETKTCSLEIAGM